VGNSLCGRLAECGGERKKQKQYHESEFLHGDLLNRCLGSLIVAQETALAFFAQEVHSHDKMSMDIRIYEKNGCWRI
jgi:hypothetical protein